MHFLYLGMILDIKVLSKYVCQLALSITKVITHKSFAHSLCSEISLIEQDTIEYVSVVYTALAAVTTRKILNLSKLIACRLRPPNYVL